jgi:hypothetical protein
MSIYSKILAWSLLPGLFALPQPVQAACDSYQVEWLLKAPNPEARAQQREALLLRAEYLHALLYPEADSLPQEMASSESNHLKLCFTSKESLRAVLAKINQQQSTFEILQPLKEHANLWAQTGLRSGYIAKVKLQKSPEAGLEIQLNADGALILERLTVGLLKQKLGLFLDNKLLLAPKVITVIKDGRLLITGPQTALFEQLAWKLDLARLPNLDAVELLAISSDSQAQASQRLLPPEVLKLLDKHFPGWSFPSGLAYVGQEQYWREKPDFEPFVVTGDFDGNRLRDLAVLIRHPAGAQGARESILILRQMPSGHYLPEVLEQTEAQNLNAWSGISLWRSPSGEKMYNFEEKKEFITTHDTLSLIVWEKASISWVWTGEAFKEIMTGD